MFAVLKGYLLSKLSRKRLEIISEMVLLKIESEELPISITTINCPRLKISIDKKLKHFSHRDLLQQWYVSIKYYQKVLMRKNYICFKHILLFHLFTARSYRKEYIQREHCYKYSYNTFCINWPQKKCLTNAMSLCGFGSYPVTDKETIPGDLSGE